MCSYELHVCFCDINVVVYFAASVAKLDDKCLTSIVIRITQINPMFCGGNVNYMIISPSHNGTINGETLINITGLTRNTNYSITVTALRRDDIIHQNTMVESTLESLSKYI